MRLGLKPECHFARVFEEVALLADFCFQKRFIVEVGFPSRSRFCSSEARTAQKSTTSSEYLGGTAC